MAVKQYIVVDRMTTDLYQVVGFIDAKTDEEAQETFRKEWSPFADVYKLVPKKPREASSFGS